MEELHLCKLPKFEFDALGVLDQMTAIQKISMHCLESEIEDLDKLMRRNIAQLHTLKVDLVVGSSEVSTARYLDPLSCT